MIGFPDAIRTFTELREYVRHVLCSQENLIPEQFRLDEQDLVRAGEACGRQYCLYGPRSVRLGAIWASDHNQVYFYNAKGERFLKVSLPERIGRDSPPAADGPSPE